MNLTRNTRTYSLNTVPETNIVLVPKKWWLEDYFLLGRPIFRGYYRFRECIILLGAVWPQQTSLRSDYQLKCTSL